MELKQALQKAIDFEQKGQSVYEEAAKKTSNDGVKKVFMWLSGEEKKHEKWLREFAEQKQIDPDTKSVPAKAFFKTTVDEFREKIVLSKDDIAAYDQAMQLEKESYELYKEEMDTHPELREFFSLLMEQEQSHYDLLMKTRDYFSDPDLFFQREERWLFEGG